MENKDKFFTIKNISMFLKKHRIVVVGQRISDFLILLRTIPVEALIVCEEDLSIDKYSEECLVVSQESIDHRRRKWSNQSLGKLTSFSNLLFKEHLSETPIEIITYSASKEWENIAFLSEGKLKITAPSVDVKNLIDNKIFTRFSLENLGLPVPQSIEVSNIHLDFSYLKNMLGEPFILQAPMGSSGKGTFLIDNECLLDEIKNSCFSNIWLASRYMGNMTVNVHGIAQPNNIYISMPSVQITGLKELTGMWGSYCGNDFFAAQNISKSVKTKIQKMVEAVGQWLFKLGFIGIFGVDFVLNGEDAYIIEINPRIQGSTWLLSEIELLSGRVPILLKHTMLILEEKAIYENTKELVKSNTIGASYLLIRSTFNKPIKLHHNFHIGAYAFDSMDMLQWKHECTGLIELNDDEILVFGLPIHRDAIIEPGSVIVRIASKQQLITDDGQYLTSFGHKVVKAIKDELKQREI